MLEIKEGALRAALAVLGLGLALASWHGYRTLAGNEKALSGLLAAYGALDRSGDAAAPAASAPAAGAADAGGGQEEGGAAEIGRQLHREPDPERMGLIAARSLLSMDPGTRNPAAETAGGGQGSAPLTRYQEAARLARQALARRPSSPDAAMLLGTATYLGWLEAHDTRLFTSAESWRRPLAAAVALAPGRSEPKRYLAAVYLEVWPALSPARRQEAGALIGQALADPSSFDLLVGPWLAAEGDRAAALAQVPDTSHAWAEVQEVFTTRRDWEAACLARRRWDTALEAELAGELSLADARFEDGDWRGARALDLDVIARARPSGRAGSRAAELLSAALTRCPAGPVDHATATHLAPQLEWALDGCLAGRCPLEGPQLERLAQLASAEPAAAALSALFAGDRSRADLIERRADSLEGEGWASYLAAKARLLAGISRFEEARAALSRFGEGRGSGALYWQTKALLARGEGDAAEELRASESLARLTPPSWPAAAWHWRHDTARLEMVLAAPARGLAVQLESPPPDGALVELRLDGLLAGACAVHPGASLTATPPSGPLGAGSHILQLSTVAGARVLPGEVTPISSR